MAAEQAVSILLTRLAPLIEETVREEFNLLRNADKEAQRLFCKLKTIHQVLEDAELKAARERREAAFRSDVVVTTDRKVENWLRKLENITYEIEDALDKWEVENIKRRLGEESGDVVSSSSSSKKKKVFSFLESACLCFNQTIDRRSMAWEIKEINQKLDLIAKENEDEFNFVPNVGHVCKDFKRNTSTTSFVDVSEVYGRDCDKDSIITKFLAGNEHDHDSVKVVSIVGVGGMGKTTLAQLIYNDSRVQEQFPVRKWICVSDPFDKIKIAKEILGPGNDSSSFQTLLEDIEKSMTGKMFLLVLDDVWVEDDAVWRDLKVALTKGAASGSKILVTTRKEKVAIAMDKRSIVHPLKPLGEAYCWSILSKIAFHGRTEGECKMLKETGQEIARKCKGLPLAAKIMGGLLQDKTSLKEWEIVLKSDMWELKDVRESIFPLLTLSYDELHPAVRRCFSYCAIFQKDTNIRVDMLIRFWMAQGLLSSTKNADDMELTGREYFNDLAMRSFFQDFEKDDTTGHINYCKMHDMVHDYAQFLTNNECLVLDQVHRGGKKISNTDIRHLNMIKRDAEVLDSIYNYGRLRSFMCDGCVIVPNLFAHLKKVRLVRVYKCQLQNIPEEIGNLIHLRCLDISFNEHITELPESICDLYNLETLCINGCDSLGGLPQKIHKLINLRHLFNINTNRCKLPKEFEKLTNLQTLSLLYAASKSGDSTLGLLKNLNHLAGHLQIIISGEGWDVEEAMKADLISKELIQSLRLCCGDGMDMNVVEALQPHPNLLKLHYTGRHLPKWITTLTHLKVLIVANKKMPRSPTDLSIGDLFSHGGQFPFLEILKFWSVEIKHVGSNFLSRTFPNVRELWFVACQNWEEWEDTKGDEDGGNENARSTNAGQLRLEKLRVWDCSKLKALPNHFLRARGLQDLDINWCRCLYQWPGGEKELKLLNELHYIPRKKFW